MEDPPIPNKKPNHYLALLILALLMFSTPISSFFILPILIICLIVWLVKYFRTKNKNKTLKRHYLIHLIVNGVIIISFFGFINYQTKKLNNEVTEISTKIIEYYDKNGYYPNKDFKYWDNRNIIYGNTNNTPSLYWRDVIDPFCIYHFNFTIKKPSDTCID